VNQLLTSKQNLSEKLTEFDAKLQVEVDSINSAFSRVVENLTKHKNMLLDELKGSMKYRIQQTQDQFDRLCGQIDRMKEAWTDLNSFSNQIGKQSYEQFSQIKSQNNKELSQSKFLVESAISFLNQRDPMFVKNNVNVNDLLGTIT
jgi:TolA-binding protein